MSKNFVLNFDILLACLFPLALFLVALRTNIRTWTWSNIRDLLTLKSFKATSHGPFSLEKAYQSYIQYGRLAGTEVTARRAVYNTLGRGHKRLGNTIGYPAKLDRLKYVTDLNATVTDGIAELAAREFGLELEETYGGGGGGGGSHLGDLGRVREALKHFVRDWSGEGAGEREKIFSPVLDVLRAVRREERRDKRVLVPGSGLGRLAWEISELGYATTANELSFFMNLAFRFLLCPETTTSRNEHTLRPYAHWFSHQRSNDSLFRSIRFPDVVPRLSTSFRLAETDFLNLSPPPVPTPTLTPSDAQQKFIWSKSESQSMSNRQAGYDYIVTLFFIDTSLNVFETMEHIHNLLRPGGTWINMGPLLWTAGGRAKLELSLDEVVHAAEEIGFTFRDGDAAAGDVNARRTVECEYTGDLNAMMRWIYKAEFWVATKSK